MPSPVEFKIALIQMRCSTDPAENLARALARIRAAARDGAQLICLPELFRSQYFCQTEDHANFDLAEPIPGPSTAALAEVAREAGVVLIGSLFERRAAGVYHNTAVIFDVDGSIKGRYRKMHIPDDPLYYEKFYFTPGDLGFQAIELEAATLEELFDDVAASGLLPEPLEDEGRSDASCGDGGELAFGVSREQQDGLSQASAGDQESVELSGLLELVESPERGDDALFGSSVLPSILDDLEVGACAGRLGAEEHGASVIETP